MPKEVLKLIKYQAYNDEYFLKEHVHEEIFQQEGSDEVQHLEN